MSKKPKLLAQMGRYHFYQDGEKFNVKIDDIWFFTNKDAPKSLVDLLKDLNEEQKGYEKYYNEAAFRVKDLEDTINELKEGKIFFDSNKEESE